MTSSQSIDIGTPSISRRRAMGLIAGAGCSLLPVVVPAVTPAEVPPPGERFQLLYSFTRHGGHGHGAGWSPAAGLIQASDGYLYGTCMYGGAYGFGSIYRLDKPHHVHHVHSFAAPGANEGAVPQARLLQASDGMLYGTTSVGYGTDDVFGTIFRVDSTGAFETLHRFRERDGGHCRAALVQGTDGNLYGTGWDAGDFQSGTLFRLTLAGGYTVLHALSPQADGQYLDAGLVEGSDGWFYGAAYQGGEIGWGTLFRISPAGAFQVIHQFDHANGGAPRASLIFGADGLLYGTTEYGGPFDDGTVFRIRPDGSEYEVLYSFDRRNGMGALPATPLLLGSDGRYYGTVGILLDVGTVFVLDDAFKPVVLHTFPVAWAPNGELLEIDGQALVGTLQDGCDQGFGGIYTLRRSAA